MQDEGTPSLVRDEREVAARGKTGTSGGARKKKKEASIFLSRSFSRA